MKKGRILLWCLLMFLFSVTAGAQTLSISGTVIDGANNEPIIGASVLEEGTTNGTITDFDGNFQLTVAAGANITVSYIGYKSQTLPASATMNVVLREDTEVLEEVVVTGYTTQRKADLTGAVAVMDMSGATSEADASVLASMQGRLPGVQITTDAAPGGAGSIRIRGMSSINGTDPLYVIDGVPTTENIASLNQADIESIQVLKDASSASIYGSRAANGVIIITTKKAKGDRLNVNLSYAATLQTIAKRYQTLNAQQWGEAYWAANLNAGLTPSHPFYGNGATPKLLYYLTADGTVRSTDTDWQDAVYRQAWTHNVSASVSHASEKGNVFFSGNYINQDGLIQETYYRRFNVRLNSNYKIGKYVGVGENLMVAKWSDNGFSTGEDRGIPYTAMRQHPAIPVYDSNGNFTSPMQLASLDIANPVHQLRNGRDNKNDSWRIFGNAYLEIYPVKGLTLKSNIGIEHLQYFNNILTRKVEPSDVAAVSRAYGQGDTWTWSNTAAYANQWGNHRFNALLGTETIGYKFQDLSGWRNQYAFEDTNYMVLNAGEGTQTNGGGMAEWRLFSLFGKVDYNYADRYLFSVTVRRDATSRLYGAKNHGWFPAFSAAWRFTEENFYPKNDVLTDAKLRIGWGENGNAAISDNYATWSTYAYSQGNAAYDFNATNSSTVAGVVVAKSGNQDLKWETTMQTNVGLDMTFLRGDITASLDWYLKDTKDMLTVPPTLSVAGENAAVWRNTGDMRNMGVEFILNYNSPKYNDFSWNASFNISHYKNTVVHLNDFVSQLGGDYRLIEGQPMGVYYGYVVEGIFQDAAQVASHATQTGAAPGRLMYKDIVEDGIIDEKDQQIIGDPNPAVQMGLNLDFKWKGLTLSMFFNSELGFDIYNTTKRQLDFMSYGGVSTNRGISVLDAWTPTNTSATVPALSAVDNNNEMRMSTYYVENGSYLKMKYLKLSYDLPKKALDAMHAQNVGVFVQVENVFTLTGYSGLDPELPLGGYGARIDNGPYPRSRSFSLGLNLNF
ncbi:MAG: TonB-dependent receptor [Paludibacteraceae bacterium]|nr:TonB-dependent receptor [Paludibacteraceae bacterium]